MKKVLVLLRLLADRRYRGNAEGSTLRRTLGCLVGPSLGFQLRRVGSGGRYTFTNPGEQILDRWMDQHAFVTWLETKTPWEIEKKLLSSGLSLPLNVDGNPSQQATTVLCAMRLKARCLARFISNPPADTAEGLSCAIHQIPKRDRRQGVTTLKSATAHGPGFLTGSHATKIISAAPFRAQSSGNAFLSHRGRAAP